MWFYDETIKTKLKKLRLQWERITNNRVHIRINEVNRHFGLKWRISKNEYTVAKVKVEWICSVV